MIFDVLVWLYSFKDVFSIQCADSMACFHVDVEIEMIIASCTMG